MKEEQPSSQVLEEESTSTVEMKEQEDTELSGQLTDEQSSTTADKAFLEDPSTDSYTSFRSSIQAPGDKSSVDSMTDIMPPPAMASTPPVPYGTLESDTSDEALEHWEQYHVSQTNRIKAIKVNGPILFDFVQNVN